MHDGDADRFGERLIERDVSALAQEFDGVFSRETIDRYVRECRDLLHERGRGGLVNFAGLHAGRFARERLSALALTEGHVEKTRPEVLFVCVQNAGRSQIAAALTHHLSDGWISVRSAGSQPAQEIEAETRAALAELGLDIDQAFPKPLTDEVVRAADVVVTMGCGDACPVYPGKHYEDWHVADPDGQPLGVVREIRDDIAGHVRTLVASLAPATTS